MTSKSNQTISGHLTGADWNLFKNRLEVGGDPHCWFIAYEFFLQKRIDSRYLAPIRTIRKHGTLEGEGFTIVSIQCALIEFFASLRIGKNHSLNPKDDYEYRNSSDLYREFLSKAPLFSEFFDDLKAREFYSSIRCALLHEARTKNEWKIWAEGSIPIDFDRKFLFRNNLQTLIESYLTSYKDELMKSPSIQSAFIRKIDNLAFS